MHIKVSGSSNSPLSRFDFAAAAAVWAQEVEPLAQEALKAAAPVGSSQTPPGGATRPPPGRLRDSIRGERKVTDESMTITFVADGPVPGYVIDGTRAHDIPPGANRKYLYFMGGGGPTFVGPAGSGRVVHHPGTAPNPFPTRALSPLMSIIQQRLEAAIADQLSA